MSGGGISPRPTRPSESIKRRFQETLPPEEPEDEEDRTEDREREEDVKRNVFISFHTEDEAQVNLLRAQAKNEDFDMEFRDYSVKEPFDREWKRQCAKRVGQSSVTICFIGQETATREAVLWELKESYRQGKKVVGVRIHKGQNHPVPEPLRRNGSPIVNWERDAIREYL